MQHHQPNAMYQGHPSGAQSMNQGSHGLQQSSVSQHGIPPLGVPPNGLGGMGMPPPGKNPHGIPLQGMPPQGMPPQGMPPQGLGHHNMHLPMAQHGMPPNTTNPGMAPSMSPMGMGHPGMPHPGMPPQGMPQPGVGPPNMMPGGMSPPHMGPPGMPPQGMPGMNPHMMNPGVPGAMGIPPGWRPNMPGRPPMWQGTAAGPGGPMQPPPLGGMMGPMRMPGGPMNPPLNRVQPHMRGMMDPYGPNVMMSMPMGGPMAPPGMFPRSGFPMQVQPPRVTPGRQGSVAELQRFVDHLKSNPQAPEKNFSYMEGKTTADQRTSWINEQNIIIPRAPMARFLLGTIRRMRSDLLPADGLTHSAVRDGARRMYLCLEAQAANESPPQEPLFRKPFGVQENDPAKTDWSFAVLGPFNTDAFFGPLSGDGSGSLRTMLEMDGEGESPESGPREDGWAFSQKVLDKAAIEFGGPLGLKSVRRIGLREEASELVAILCSVFRNRVERLLYIAERYGSKVDWRVLEGCIVNDVVMKEQILSSRELIRSTQDMELEKLLYECQPEKFMSSSEDDSGD